MKFRSKKLFFRKNKTRKTKRRINKMQNKTKQKKGGNPDNERFYLGEIQYDNEDLKRQTKKNNNLFKELFMLGVQNLTNG